jgi:dephospho-CoA kinase
MTRLSLIGMSGSGKSSWSMKLSEIEFKRFCCDQKASQTPWPVGCETKAPANDHCAAFNEVALVTTQK